MTLDDPWVPSPVFARGATIGGSKRVVESGDIAVAEELGDFFDWPTRVAKELTSGLQLARFEEGAY